MFAKKLTMALALTTSMVMSGAAFAEAPESDDPIIIVQNNWTSQLVLSTVVGKVLEDMGYTVEYAPSDSQLQFKAIADGDMHFQVEAWEGSMKTAFEKAVAEDGMVDAGANEETSPRTERRNKEAKNFTMVACEWSVSTNVNDVVSEL